MMQSNADSYIHTIPRTGTAGPMYDMQETKENSRSFRANGYFSVRVLGTGARSIIYEVRSQDTGRRYALKQVCRNGPQDDRFIEQAQSEFEIASQIDHPNIRKVHRFFKQRKLLSLKEVHLLMEYCPGKSVQQNPPSSVLDACGIYAQVANALHQLNRQGFVHADMKPNNIIVDEEGNAKIIDFGQSCPIGTVKTRIQGTPDYLAPEQLLLWPCDARTDVFNFGASLYHTLTGRPGPKVVPQQGSMQTPEGKIPDPPEKFNSYICPALSRLVMDCIQLQPKDRPPSMKDVVRRMGIVLQKQMDTAPQ